MTRYIERGSNFHVAENAQLAAVGLNLMPVLAANQSSDDQGPATVGYIEG